jgi:hypothetical protein
MGTAVLAGKFAAASDVAGGSLILVANFQYKEKSFWAK